MEREKAESNAAIFERRVARVLKDKGTFIRRNWHFSELKVTLIKLI